jgi:ATP-dependent exoDNAse (exonuclease V) beta subunit
MSAVGKSILYLKSRGQNQEGQPLSYKDFMVLCPASNFVDSLAKTLQSELAIPTKLRVKASIPSDYWRLLLVLRMLHSEDSLALRQWLSISGLSDEEITDIRRKAMQNADSLYSYCARRTTQEFMRSTMLSLV